MQDGNNSNDGNNKDRKTNNHSIRRNDSNNRYIEIVITVI